jgi:NAD(P)-dependent dehydrogenase (short-subunit alcohol dehydrogenase family)
MTKIVLITGASRGIGRATARQLLETGYTVYGTSRRPAQAEIDGIHMLALDVTDEESVRECVAQVQAEAGRIDVLINNAGYDIYGAAEDTTFEELVAQMDTNFYGVVRVTQAVLPLMRAQGGGKIINMSSIGGLVALPFNSAYAASKFALEGYSESLRYELLPFGIYVSLVEPGQVRTETLDESIISTQQSTVYPNDRITERARADGVTASLRPEQVAKAVLDIVQRERPGLRYAPGTQTRYVNALRRWLPWQLYEGFMMRQFVTPVLPSPR